MEAGRGLRDELREYGYSILPNVIGSELLDRLEREVRGNLQRPTWDYEMDGVKMYGDRILRAVDLAGKSPALLEFLADPVFDTVMRASLLDSCDHALLSSSTALEVHRQDGAKPQTLHRDENNYPPVLPRIPGGAEYLVNIILAGTDFTAGNGGTLIVPGSNKWPRERKPTTDDPVIAIEMPRGSCAVWLGSTYHGAGVNRTDEPRLGIIMTFAAGWLRTIENHFLMLDPARVATLPPQVQQYLGYDLHGVLGSLEWKSPMKTLLRAREDARA